MAVIAIPQTFVEQPNQNQSLSDGGSTGFQRSFKDLYATLKSTADTVNTGDILGANGKEIIRSYSLQRCPGNMGILTFNLSPANEYTTDGATAQYPNDETWTCKSVRNDVSILAYCGSSANRISLELWMKEADAEIADGNGFHKTERHVDNLNSQEIAIANKIRKGVESVIRFYPVLTRNRVYDTCPQNMLENLGFIDTPPTPSTHIDNPNIPQASRKKVKKPSNLSTIISGHSWLKVQDDVTETGDGRFQRIESWMGISTADNATGWDADLYGQNRWPMPLSTANS